MPKESRVIQPYLSGHQNSIDPVTKAIPMIKLIETALTKSTRRKLKLIIKIKRFKHSNYFQPHLAQNMRLNQRA